MLGLMCDPGSHFRPELVGKIGACLLVSVESRFKDFSGDVDDERRGRFSPADRDLGVGAKDLGGFSRSLGFSSGEIFLNRVVGGVHWGWMLG